MYFDEAEYLAKFVEKHNLETIIKNKLKELSLTAPIDSIEVIRSMHNIDLEFIKFESKSIGGILVKGPRESCICINTLFSKGSQNFIGMHELCHYWFHPPNTHICKEHEGKVEGREFQANYMAAEALMPRELFIRKYYEFHKDVDRLCKYFMVGEYSVIYRIKNLSADIARAKLEFLYEDMVEIPKRDIFSDENSFGSYFLKGL